MKGSSSAVPGRRSSGSGRTAGTGAITATVMGTKVTTTKLSGWWDTIGGAGQPAGSDFVAPCGICVNDGSAELWNGVHQLVLGFVGQIVGRTDSRGGLDVEVGFGVEGVADPTHAQAADFGDARDVAQGSFTSVDKFGFHGVHQPAIDVTYRGAKHGEDRHGDQ